MSQIAEHKPKKRKHAAAVADTTTASEPSPKRSKTDKVKKDKSKSKTKGDVTKGKGKEVATGQFRVVQASLPLSIPPVFANNLRAGAEEMLDSMLMRYIPVLEGVVLAHDNLRFLAPQATVKADCPFANCRVNFEATVWSPYVGMRLVGKVNLCSPDHVSLLVHRTFNVSIPRHHIPTDNWEFEYGPAENDPEYGGDEAEGEGEAEGADAQAQAEDSGRWVHKLTSDNLGGKDGNLEFTVIGMTIANQMLSLIGSIQVDPFSPEHVPDHNVQTSAQKTPRARKAPEPEPEPIPEEIAEDAIDSEEEDTFQALGRMGDEAAARRAKAEQDAQAKKRKLNKVQDSAEGAQVEKKKRKKKSS